MELVQAYFYEIVVVLLVLILWVLGFIGFCVAQSEGTLRDVEQVLREERTRR